MKPAQKGTQKSAKSATVTSKKFKTRYATLDFSIKANLDKGAMWPTAFELKGLTAAEEAKSAALAKRAVSSVLSSQYASPIQNRRNF